MAQQPTGYRGQGFSLRGEKDRFENELRECEAHSTKRDGLLVRNEELDVEASSGYVIAVGCP